MIASAVCLASVLAFADGPTAEASASASASESRPSPYVQVGLGGGAFVQRKYETRTTSGGPTFAVEAGGIWNPLPRLRLSVGGMLAHGGQFRNTSGSSELTANLRVGLGTSRLWGYGLLGLGATLTVDDDALHGDANTTDFLPGPSMLAGLGVRGHLGAGVSLGFEVASLMSILPNSERYARISGLLVMEARFGAPAPRAR